MSENIILIGFMAVGKGRTARKLSRTTGLYTVDTDDLIQALVKMTVKKIFRKKGEVYFRELEQKTADWLEKNVTATIVSTGGGFFQVRNLSRLGRVVYLHSSFDAIIEKIMNSPQAEKRMKKRPLLCDLDRARRLYEQRLPQYRRAADLEVNVTAKTRIEVVRELVRLLKLEKRD